MKVVVVTNDFPPKPGGIQQYLGKLTDAIDGEVLVLAPKDGPAAGTVRGEEVVRRHRRRFLWPTPSVRRWVVREVRRFDPDLVLFGAPYPLAWMAPRLKKHVDAPIGIICHGAEITIPAVIPGMRTLMRRSLRAADHRFAVSEYTARRVARLSGRHATYLGSGVDLEAFSPGDRRRGEVAVVGCVSRFVPRKGQGRLLRAVARLNRNGVACRVALVGSGRLERRLRKQAVRLGVDADFHVSVPWVELPQLYRQMDLFAMPCRSRWGGLEVEGLGIVYLEAAASGLPVVAGDSGGAPETVLPGRTGFVATSVSEIAEAIELLVRDPQRAESMGQAGRRYVSETYTWDRVASRIAKALGPQS